MCHGWARRARGQGCREHFPEIVRAPEPHGYPQVGPVRGDPAVTARSTEAQAAVADAQGARTGGDPLAALRRPTRATARVTVGGASA